MDDKVVLDTEVYEKELLDTRKRKFTRHEVSDNGELSEQH